MKILFPNSYGLQALKTTAEQRVKRVMELQNSYRFSDQYRDFLLLQNGFFSDAFYRSNTKSAYLNDRDEVNATQDFQQLLAYDAHEKYCDLGHTNGFNILREFCFVIGNDLAGNFFVEVLIGKFKGYIGSLDVGMFATCRSFEEFIEDLDEFFEDTGERLTNYQKITSRGLGLIAFHAASMKDFLENCFVFSRRLGEDELEILIADPPSVEAMVRD